MAHNDLAVTDVTDEFGFCNSLCGKELRGTKKLWSLTGITNHQKPTRLCNVPERVSAAGGRAGQVPGNKDVSSRSYFWILHTGASCVIILPV
jgi:hypothetical protein